MGTIVFLISLTSVLFWLEGRHPGFSRPANFDRRVHAIVNIKAGLIALVATVGANAGVFAAVYNAESHNLGLFRHIHPSEPDFWNVIFIVAGLFILDYSNYWIHRVQHMTPQLWKFHRVHHTDPGIDVTSGMRFHPLESVFRGACQCLFVIALGISARSLEIYLWGQTLVLVWSHANLRIGSFEFAGPLAIVVGPTLHQRHHDIERRRHDSNYGIVLSIWDRIHRTYSGRQSEFAINQGLADASEFSQTLRGILSEPFLRSAPIGKKF